MTRAFNMDCMEAMKQFPDKYFDLAVVDPPYGDGVAERERDGKPWNRFGERFDRYKTERSPSQQLPQERERENANAKSSRLRIAEGGQSAGLVEPGRRSSEKNH